jgi:hypothetical protein
MALLSPLLVVPSGGGTAAGAQRFPRIVNGTITASYRAVGAHLPRSGGFPGNGLCSATLIGCRTVLTAAHCVCDDRANDAEACATIGLPAPESLEVFLQHAGFLAVERVVIHPDYLFGVRADLALLTLAQPAAGVTPSPINTTGPVRFGTKATIVGFGRTGGDPGRNRDVGLKRSGTVVTAPCPTGVPDAENVCWDFTGADSNTCDGDSGGPLFVTSNGDRAPVLAGVGSAGESFSCLAPDRSNNTDVFRHREWIEALAGDDLGAVPCPLFPGVVTPGDVSVAEVGTLSVFTPQVRKQIEVPAGTPLLRVALNGEVVTPTGFPANDFDLFVRAGVPPTEDEFDCADLRAGTFAFCEVSNPVAGSWHILVQHVAGVGQFQLTGTSFAAAADIACTGDCNADAHVTVDELLTGVSIALGDRSLGDCVAFDRDEDGAVTVDEITLGVANALNGCPNRQAGQRADSS